MIFVGNRTASTDALVVAVVRSRDIAITLHVQGARIGYSGRRRFEGQEFERQTFFLQTGRLRTGDFEWYDTFSLL